MNGGATISESRIAKGWFKWLFVVMAVIVGCNVQKRNIARLDQYAIQYPAEMSKLSNKLYPCFNGVLHSDTITTLKHDTLLQPGQIVISHVKDTIIKTITLPGKVITNTVIKSVHDTIVNQRALSALQAQYQTKNDSLVIMKTKYATTSKNLSVWRLIALILSGLTLAFIVVKVYMLISGGWVKKII